MSQVTFADPIQIERSANMNKNQGVCGRARSIIPAGVVEYKKY